MNLGVVTPIKSSQRRDTHPTLGLCRIKGDSWPWWAQLANQSATRLPFLWAWEILWKALHNKFPTDDNLWKRGIHFVSVCTNFGHDSETVDHFFLYRPFTRQIWNWISSMLNCCSDLSSIHNVLAAITFSFFFIWKRRNLIKF